MDKSISKDSLFSFDYIISRTVILTSRNLRNGVLLEVPALLKRNLMPEPDQGHPRSPKNEVTGSPFAKFSKTQMVENILHTVMCDVIIYRN